MVSVGVTWIDDDGEALTADLTLNAPHVGERSVVGRLEVSVAGRLGQIHRQVLIDEAAAVIEAWSTKQGIDVIDHRSQLEDALTDSSASNRRTVQMLGASPFLYPPKGTLASGKKGARALHELTEVPAASTLSEVSRAGQTALLDLVESSGGRMGMRRETSDIQIGHLDALVAVIEEWVDHYGDPADGGTEFRGRPGFWHALDRLVPLQDPNRWDPLRKAVNVELQNRGWKRNGERGSKWWRPAP